MTKVDETVRTTIQTISSEATTSMGGKPYHTTHKPRSTILDTDSTLFKCSIPAAPRKDGTLHKSGLVGVSSWPKRRATIIHPQGRKGAKTPDRNRRARAKCQHRSRLYATTQPGYDMRSGGSLLASDVIDNASRSHKRVG